MEHLLRPVDYHLAAGSKDLDAEELHIAYEGQDGLVADDIDAS